MIDLKKGLQRALKGMPRPATADPKVVGMIKKGANRTGKRKAKRRSK